MLGEKKFRASGRANPLRKRGLELPRKGISQKFFTVITFCLATLSFTIFFTAIPREAAVTAPNREITVVSTHGKIGVSAPPTLIGKMKSKTALASQGNVLLTNPVIPPKPDWVSLPLYVDPLNGAAQYAANHPTAAGIKYITRMSHTPVAQWFGDWNADVANDTDSYVSAAAAAGSVPVLVLYNIPHRDCGGYSVGGANNLAEYTHWIRQAAAGIGNRTAVVVLEPDALGAVDCLPTSQRQERYQSIASAVSILKATTKASIYIDAGTPVWQPSDVMASRLRLANVTMADGFSINVSYFISTARNQAYGDELSHLIGNKHYVIDTSRNGGDHAVTGMQCNPSFASFGDTPTTKISNAVNDGLLWIKIPWESDGECGSSPGPGQEYWSYAIRLAQNAGW
jgi:endoglucanase